MRFLYTGAFRFPAKDAAAARVLNNAKLLRELGHEVVFLSWGGELRETDKCGEKYYYQGFEYMVTKDIDGSHALLSRIGRLLTPGKKAAHWIKNHCNSCDVVITYNSPFLFNRFMISLCRKKRKKLILDLTEWYDAAETPGGKYSPLYRLNELNMSSLQKKIPNKILISKYLCDYYMGSNNILLPPLVDMQENKWKPDLNIIQSLEPFDGITFIYAGNYAHKDRFDVMVDALVCALENRLKVRLLVLGIALEQIRMTEIYSKIEKYPSHFIFMGRVSQEQVPAYYAQSDFSILFRDDNRKNNAGFPTKLVESMAAGRPVLTNCTSNISQYVKHLCNGVIVDNMEADSLYQGICTCAFMNRPELESLKENARIQTLNCFDYRSNKDEMKLFLDRLIR